MGLTRAEFIKLCMSTAAGASLVSLIGPDIKEVFAATADGKPPVIWLQGASCTGCSISLLNSVDPAIENVLLDVISLKYHPNISAAAGDMVVDILKNADEYRDQFVLVVEGAIPVKERGIFCTIAGKDHREMTMLEAVTELGNLAKMVIAAGQCASFGGIPAAVPNPSGSVPVSEIVKKKPVVNISLCPMHPDHFLGTVVYVLKYGELPELDRLNRPKMFYPGPIHDNCERRGAFEAGKFAQFIGDEGCLAMLGCKGFISNADCPTRGWNNNTNWCVRAGAPCLGCSEPFFPDSSAPFYGSYPLTNKSGVAYNKITPHKTEFVEPKK